MMIRKLGKCQRTAVEMDGAKGVTKQISISSADGSPHFSFRVFTVEPGGHTPYHRHDSEHLNYVIEGRGCIVKGDGSEQPIERGDFALVLPHEKHQYRNVSSESALVLICAVPSEFE